MHWKGGGEVVWLKSLQPWNAQFSSRGIWTMGWVVQLVERLAVEYDIRDGSHPSKPREGLWFAKPYVGDVWT